MRYLRTTYLSTFFTILLVYSKVALCADEHFHAQIQKAIEQNRGALGNGSEAIEALRKMLNSPTSTGNNITISHNNLSLFIKSLSELSNTFKAASSAKDAPPEAKEKLKNLGEKLKSIKNEAAIANSMMKKLEAAKNPSRESLTEVFNKLKNINLEIAQVNSEILKLKK